MPKPKPTEVIRHEIIFGKVERELLENATTSGAAMGLVKDVLPYLKDWQSALAFVEAVAFLLELFGIKTPIPTPVDLWEWWQDFQKKKDALGDWLNPFPEIWETIVGGTGGFGPVITPETTGLTNEELAAMYEEMYSGPTSPAQWEEGTPRPYG